MFMPDPQYTHKIEGVDTEILYLLAPDGTLLRSLVKIKECAEKFQLTEADLQLVLAFMEEQRRTEERRVENPDLDSDWIYDEQSMPPGWRVKEYSYYSKVKCTAKDCSLKRTNLAGCR